MVGDAGREGLGALLGEQQEDTVAPQLVVVDHRPHGAGHVAGHGPPLPLHVGGGPLQSGGDEVLPRSEVPKHGLHAHPGLGSDVCQGDVRGEALQVEGHHGFEHPPAGLLDRVGPRRHPVRSGLRLHVNGR